MIDWKTCAALFPGQGSQVLGMGADFARRFPLARQTFEQADDILGYRLSKICWNGPSEKLDQTAFTQPALYVCSLAIWRVLIDLLPSAKPAWLAGHSLGEFSALAAAEAFSFAAGLRLVAARGRYMQRAGERYPGAMAAILALDSAQVETLCASVSAESGKIVVLANDNCPGQAVVSGDSEAVDELIKRAGAAGARRAVKLAVSVAAHSPLMASAADGFRQVLARASFSPPNAPVIGNVTAQPLVNAADIATELDRQLTQSVRWTDSMRAMIEAGAETFVEIGAGNVLSGLVRRMDRSKRRISINSVETLEAFLESQ